ncbi:transposase [Streptomyces sp. NPDC002667]|uniref:transposase n=1 Tax=Streptomyces sp. NPDC002667 TaxID=3364657 RepID=UPI00368F752E
MPDRQAINGMVYKIRTGVSWRDLPARYGPWQTVYRGPRPARSAAAGRAAGAHHVRTIRTPLAGITMFDPLNA